ncbi:MAG: extracellular solute-binding protein, partial [Acidimicrobiales bacterium]|nr:extracellular solute-binding protein [Acidimicrobiales bacterium]
MRRSRTLLAVLLSFTLLASACGGGDDETTTTTAAPTTTVAPTTTAAPDPLAGTSVSVFGPESSDEEAGALRDALGVFAAESGIEINYTGARDAADQINAQAAGGNAPDIFVFPQPGKLADFAREGWVLPLPADVITAMEADWSPAWTAFGNVDGAQYGIPTKSDLKSLVWYKPAKFADKGYSVPGTWDDLKSLADDMIANG